jgi:cysteine synthase A
MANALYRAEGVNPTLTTTESGLRVAEDVLDLLGRTPLLRLKAIEPKAGVKIWAKCEMFNPGGSVKDRAALFMVQDAERSGKLAPGATIIEATSGNTGISLAMIAAVRGYKCIVVMPEDMSVERRQILKAYGAEIVLTDSQQGMRGAVTRAASIAKKTPGAFLPCQFDNASNARSHEEMTAREILEQTGGSVAAFVSGVGSGGTVTGTARGMRAVLGKTVRIVGVEPATSAVLSGSTPGPHGIQGIGAGFVPGVLCRELLDEVVTVTDAAAEKMMRRVAREVGMLTGPSSGANVHAAVEVAKTLSAGNVVTVFCDSGERYLA